MELKAIPSQSVSVILANLPTRVDLLSGLKTILSALKSHASSLTLPQQAGLRNDSPRHSSAFQQFNQLHTHFPLPCPGTTFSTPSNFWFRVLHITRFQNSVFFSPVFQTVETKKKKPWVLIIEDSSRRQLLFKHLTTLKIRHHFQILILFI